MSFLASRRVVLQTAVSVCAAVAFAAAASAEVIVIGSDNPALKAGTVLADGKTLEIPDGASVRIMLPSGKTQLIKGPASRSVSDLAKGEKRDDGIWKQVTDYVKSSGGTSEKAIGAVRSASPKAGATSPLPFSWQQVPVDADGPVCVEKGASLTLARRSATRPPRITLVDMQDDKRAEAVFEDGKTSTGWPSGIAQREGKFAVVVPDGPMRQVSLHLVSPLPDADQTLVVLNAAGCKAQIQAWLRGVTAAAK